MTTPTGPTLPVTVSNPPKDPFQNTYVQPPNVLKTTATLRKPPPVKAPPPKKAPPKPPKKPSALDKYLAGDTTYQQQLAEYKAEEAAYRANNARQNQVTQRDFANTQRDMNQQATQDRNNQQYDFAGRGILHSGVFAKALADYNTQFNNQMNQLVQGKTDTLAQSAADLNDFLRQLSLERNSAKQDAIRRRQARLGLS